MYMYLLQSKLEDNYFNNADMTAYSCKDFEVSSHKEIILNLS